MTLFSTFFIALLVSMLLVPPLVRVSPRLGLIDIADDRKVHAGAIPRSGGIAIVLGALVPLLVWWPEERTLRAFVMGASVIFVFGVLDDRNGLHYAWKFLGQILAVAIVIAAGIRIDMVPFCGIDPVSPWLSIPLTAGFIVGVTNAINLSDGLDGLAAGTALIALTALAWMFYQNQSLSMALVTLATLGGVCGFLRYNNHPAVIFMGDTGSQFLGFTAAVLAILLTQQSNTALNPALLLLLLGLPILDTLTVMIWRIRNGRSPFLPDRNHFHHRLLDFGLYQYEAVSCIYIAQATMVLTGYSLRFESDAVVLAAYIAMSFLILLGFRLFRVLDVQFHVTDRKRLGPLDAGEWRRLYPRLPAFAIRATELFVSVLLVLSALYAVDVPEQLGKLSLALAVAFLFVSVLPPAGRDAARGLCIYLAGVAAVLALAGGGRPGLPGSFAVNTAFVAMGAALFITIQIAGRSEFKSTPLDFLVLAFVLAIVISAQFSNQPTIGVPLADTAIRLAVVFYVSEFLGKRRSETRALLPWAAVIMLGILAYRGMT
ncbi:MAG: MraY family glycosyltransferase [Pseudomonadota bacterium]